MEASSAEKAKIRKWILMAVATGKATIGVTVQHIKKFLDSKQAGISNKPGLKFVMNKLLENGHLAKKDGKYVIKKSKRIISGKETKRPKSPVKIACQKRASIKKSKSPTKIFKQTQRKEGSEVANE